MIGRQGCSFVGNGPRICRCDVRSTERRLLATVPSSWRRYPAQASRLAARLFRQEVRALNFLSDGTVLAANREWVFYGDPDGGQMQRSHVDVSKKFLAPPMSITVGPNDRILWGEYDSRAKRRIVRLFVSNDGGKNYDVARVFETGEILHIHNLVFDPALNKYWLLAGDHWDEPGIGLLDADLKGFEWVVKGKQSYRAVEVFDFGDRLVYGMDSEREPNAVMTLDKATGRVERGAEIDGSCIYACRFGGLYVLSTTVEPSKVNHSRFASIWVSRDGDRWTRVLQAEKDRWDARYFQYGSLVLPRGRSDEEQIIFSGQAVRGFDGRVFVGTLDCVQ